MSAIVISDLHAHAWPRFASTRDDGVNSRFQHLLNVLDQVHYYVMEHGVDHLIIMGDLTHRRHYVEFAVYNRLLLWLNKMELICRTVTVMVGNHDIESTGVHSLMPLRWMGRMAVVDEPSRLVIGDLGRHYFIPYMHGDAVVHAIQDARPDPDEWLFTHYAFDGKILDNEFAVPSPLKKSDADRFSRILLGHIHAPSAEDDGRIVYVGAPLHFDFGDHGERYAWLLNDERELKALPLFAPKFMTTSYPRVPVAPLEHSGFLRVLGVPRNLFGDVKKSALDNGWLDVLVQEQIVPDDAINAIAASSVMVSDAMIREYVAQQYADIDDAAREQIVQMGLEYLRLAEEQ